MAQVYRDLEGIGGTSQLLIGLSKQIGDVRVIGRQATSFFPAVPAGRLQVPPQR